MIPVHVLISSDPAAEPNYSALVGGGVSVYRFATAAEAMQRFAAVQSPIAALVVQAPGDPDVDRLLAELVFGSFMGNPMLADMRICVLGPSSVQHARIAHVTGGAQLLEALGAAGHAPTAPVLGGSIVGGIVDAVWNGGARPAPAAAAAQPAQPTREPAVVVARKQMPRGTNRGRAAVEGDAAKQPVLFTPAEPLREQGPRIEAETIASGLEPALPFVRKNASAATGQSLRTGASAVTRDHSGYQDVQVRTVTGLAQAGQISPMGNVVESAIPQPIMQQPAMSMPAQQFVPMAIQVAPGTPDPVMGWSAQSRQSLLQPAVVAPEPVQAVSPMAITMQPLEPAALSVAPVQTVPAAPARRGRFGKLRDRVKSAERAPQVPNQAQVDAALAQLASGVNYGALQPATAAVAMPQDVATANPLYGGSAQLMDRLDGGSVRFG